MNASHPHALASLALLTLLSASSVTPAATPADHLPNDNAPVTVRYSDLNLNSPAGTQILYRRLRAAAQRACGPSFALWYPQVWSKWKTCYTDTLDRAVRQVNQPTVTALHAELAGKREPVADIPPTHATDLSARQP